MYWIFDIKYLHMCNIKKKYLILRVLQVNRRGRVVFCLDWIWGGEGVHFFGNKFGDRRTVLCLV
jgi:hypothetical protein